MGKCCFPNKKVKSIQMFAE